MGKSGDAISPLLVGCRLHGLTLLSGLMCRLSGVRLQREDVGNFSVAVFPRSNGAFLPASEDREKRKEADQPSCFKPSNQQLQDQFWIRSAKYQPHRLTFSAIAQSEWMNPVTESMQRNQKYRRRSAWTTSPSRLSYTAHTLVRNYPIKRDNFRTILADNVYPQRMPVKGIGGGEREESFAIIRKQATV